MAQQRYRLKLSELKFCSLVDDPAQPNAKLLAIKRKGKADEITATAKLAKLNEELGLAFFWAFTSTNADGTDHFDLQGDTVDADFIKAAMDFMLDGGGAVDEMHDGVSTAGRVVFAFPMTPDIAKAFGVVTKQSGLMIAIKPTAEQLEKLKDGTYAGVSIAGLGTRELVKSQPGRVLKGNLYTDEIDGHQHEIHCYEDGSFWVSYATSSGAENSHSHGIVFEAGKLVILADSGHSHELAEGQPGVAIVPADAIVIVAARAPKQTGAAKSTPPIAPRSVNHTSKEPTMPNELDTLKQTLLDLTKRHERAERIVKMSGAHKAHFDTLTGDDGEAFLAKSNAEREAVVKSAREADAAQLEVVYTSLAGEVFTKRDDARLVAAVKRADESETARKDEEVAKQATAHLGNCPGDDDTHRFIVRAVLATKNADMITKALAAFDGVNAIMKDRSKASGGDGGNGAGATDSDPYDAFSKGLTAFCKAEKIEKVWTVGLEKFTATDEGKALKRAYDESRAS
jgi:hypothetical protein